MELKDLFYGIQDFFVNVAFAPLDAIRELQDSSWVAANLLNFVFIIIVEKGPRPRFYQGSY